MTITSERPVPTNPSPPPERPAGGRRWWWAVVAACAAALALVAGLVVAGDDDGDDATAPASATTTGPTTGTTTDVTTPPTTDPPVMVDRSTAVWPFAGSAERFTDPVDAAVGFAVTYLDFVDPVVGPFQQGDSRSGEVEIRPRADGPVTTVLVRQLTGEDTWSVLGAATANVDVTAPAAGVEIRSPVTVIGRAHAFEGNVAVEIRQDGNVGPIGVGFVTGGGDQLRPFEGRIGFDPPTERFGAVVLRTHSGEDGRTWEAAVVRVRLDGGETELAACGGYEPGRPAVGADEMEVKVYFTCDGGTAEPNPIPVYRVVPRSQAVLQASLEALLAGPTAAEADAGITSWFSAATAGMLRGVRLADGEADVDFGDLRSVIPNASTSAGSAVLLSELDATVLQFRTVDIVRYRIDGSCDVFGEWLQRDGCQPRTRG